MTPIVIKSSPVTNEFLEDFLDLLYLREQTEVIVKQNGMELHNTRFINIIFMGSYQIKLKIIMEIRVIIVFKYGLYNVINIIIF